MRRRPFVLCVVGALVVLLMLLPGCDRSLRDRPAQGAAATDPRQRFEWIMERFKRHFRGFNVVIPTRLGEGNEPHRLLLRFVVEDISYAIHGCDAPTEACTAQMTVRTGTHYSLMTPDPGQEETSGGDSDATEPPISPLVARARVAAEAPARPDKGRVRHPVTAEELLRRKAERSTDTYDFAYEEDRWVLKSEDIDDSVKDAIDFALERQ